MRVAILSDVHANRQALEACLDDAEASGAEAYVFLGDIVGYGGDPAYVVDVVAQYAAAGALVILGNHDAAVGSGGDGMNSFARAAIDWTREQLDAQQRRFLAGLPLQAEDQDLLFVHAEASAPRRWNYVVSAREAERSLAATPARITFCGHVHRPQLYGKTPGRPAIAYATRADVGVALAPPQRWLTVLGAVGQPRDRDPAARFALYDEATTVLTSRRVPYDIDTAARRILEAGLPPPLAHRLFVGL